MLASSYTGYWGAAPFGIIFSNLRVSEVLDAE